MNYMTKIQAIRPTKTSHDEENKTDDNTQRHPITISSHNAEVLQKLHYNQYLIEVVLY